MEANNNTNGHCEKEVSYHNLERVKQDFYDQNEHVVVTFYLKDTVPDSVDLQFNKTSLELKFITTNRQYLENNGNVPENTTFRYILPDLRGEIVPEECNFKVSKSKIEVKLKKSVVTPWSTVSSVSHVTQPPVAIVAPMPRNTEAALPETPTKPVSNGNVDKNNLPRISLDDSYIKNDVAERRKETEEEVRQIPVRRFHLGFRGLVNQSNNCYQNSVIQILANTPLLRDYCLHYFKESAINPKNPLGTKGKMVVEFVKMLRELWEPDDGRFQQYPIDTAKHIGLVAASRFRPFFQHDAQEFASYLIDAIHEDLNMGYGRKMEVEKSSNNSEDTVTPEVAWSNFVFRNDSPLINMFYGLICNRTTCQSCFKESNAYDPFTMLPIPLARPSKSVDLVALYVPTPTAAKEQPVAIHLTVPACVTYEEIKQAVRSQLNTSQVTCELKMYALQPIPPESCALVHFWRASDIPALTRPRRPGGHIDFLIYEAQTTSAKKQRNVTVHVMQMLKVSQLVITTCAGCSKTTDNHSDLRRCTRCQRVAYCDENCQVTHWKSHKVRCVPFEQSFGFPLCFTVSTTISYEKFMKMVEIGVKRFVNYHCPKESGNHGFDKHVSFSLAPDEADLQLAKSNKKKQTLQQTPAIDATNFHSHLAECSSTGCALKIRMFWLNQKTSTNCRLTLTNVALNSYRMERIIIPVSQEHVTLTDCLRLHFEAELMHTSNAWHCPQCKKPRTAIQVCNFAFNCFSVVKFNIFFNSDL